MLEVGGTKGRKGKGKVKEGQKKVKGKENKELSYLEK